MKLFPTSIMALKESKWLAVASVIMGGLITTFHTKVYLQFQLNLSASVFIVSLVASGLWAFGMSMDFPKSIVRFSRLSG